MVNYADDNHICNENENLEILKDHIESDAMTAINWFDKNQTTANTDKFKAFCCLEAPRAIFWSMSVVILFLQRIH